MEVQDLEIQNSSQQETQELKGWGGERLPNMLYDKQLKKIGVLTYERTEGWEAECYLTG